MGWEGLIGCRLLGSVLDCAGLYECALLHSTPARPRRLRRRHQETRGCIAAHCSATAASHFTTSRRLVACQRHLLLSPRLHTDVSGPLVSLVHSSRAMSKLVRMLLSALHSEQVSVTRRSHIHRDAHPLDRVFRRAAVDPTLRRVLPVCCSGDQQVGSVSADAAVRSDGAQRGRAS